MQAYNPLRLIWNTSHTEFGQKRYSDVRKSVNEKLRKLDQQLDGKLNRNGHLQTLPKWGAKSHAVQILTRHLLDTLKDIESLDPECSNTFQSIINSLKSVGQKQDGGASSSPKYQSNARENLEELQKLLDQKRHSSVAKSLNENLQKLNEQLNGELYTNGEMKLSTTLDTSITLVFNLTEKLFSKLKSIENLEPKSLNTLQSIIDSLKSLGQKQARGASSSPMYEYKRDINLTELQKLLDQKSKKPVLRVIAKKLNQTARLLPQKTKASAETTARPVQLEITSASNAASE